MLFVSELGRFHGMAPSLARGLHIEKRERCRNPILERWHMDKPRSSVTDLIAASVVASHMGRRDHSAKASGGAVDSTCCPFSLDVFAITLSQNGDACRESGSGKAQ